MSTVAAPRVYRPSGYWWRAYLVGAVVALTVMVLRGGERTFSPVGVISILITLLVLAYLALFAFRLWVYLYDDRLEIHPSLAKLIQDRLGITLYKPKIIHYRDITGLRRTRGFGGYNALVVIRRARRWQRSEYGIPYLGVNEYADLEAELLRRVPPTCELYSVNVLGHRGPFK